MCHWGQTPLAQVAYKNGEGSTKVEKNKLSFFKKIKISIFDFDGYQDLAAEKISKTIIYIVLLMLIFSIVISCIYVSQFYELINQAKNYINNNISEIKYEDYQMTVIPTNGEEVTEIDVNNIINSKIIINTQTTEEAKIQETIDKISKQNNGILFLKDRIIIKTELSTKLMEYSYKDISEEYNINKIDKQEIINILSGQTMYTFLVAFFIVMLIYMFIIYFSSILIDIFLLAILAYIVTRLAGLRLKYSAIYNIATYSLTLPVLLNIIYIVINRFTGFTIEYFQIMYTAIASIYIITSILMIKSDVIKKQYELNKIIEEQERVRQELKRKEEEQKEKEEQERRERERAKKKEKEKQKKEREEKKKNKGEGEIGETPEGGNA